MGKQLGLRFMITIWLWKLSGFDKRKGKSVKMKRMKVLLCSCIIVMSLTIVGCTDNANRDVAVEGTPMPISERESEGTQETLVEPIAKLQTETDAAFESETEMMTESYEPVEAPLLDYDSFQDRMTEEEWEGFEQYFPVLKENVEFHYAGNYEQLNKDGEPVKEGEYPLFRRYTSEEMMDIDHFATMWLHDDGVWEVKDIAYEVEEICVFDLDGDGVQELIIQWTPIGQTLVLHREDDAFYAWEIMYRGFGRLRTNGVYVSTGGAYSNSWKRIRFENGSWLEEVLFEEDWWKYYLNGEPVDEETFLEQVHMIDTAEYVTSYGQSYH